MSIIHYIACIGTGFCAFLLYIFTAKVAYIKFGGNDNPMDDNESKFVCALFWPITFALLAIAIPMRFAWCMKKIPNRIPEAKAKYIDETP